MGLSDFLGVVSLVVGVVSLAATIWFGIKQMKKRKLKQKQAQRGEGTLVESQQPALQNQELRGSGVQAQTLEVEEGEEAPP